MDLGRVRLILLQAKSHFLKATLLASCKQFPRNYLFLQIICISPEKKKLQIIFVQFAVISSVKENQLPNNEQCTHK